MPTVGRRVSAPVIAVALSLLATACGSEPPPGPRAQSSSSAPTTTSSAPADPVEAALAGLDRRAQVAQLFVAGVPLDDLGSGDAVAESGVGGLFMAGRSTAPAEELAQVSERWQAAAPGPGLWVAADQEGGDVQTLKGPGFERLPSALQQGSMPPAELAALAQGMGTALRSAGVNLDLAPVADVVPPGNEQANAPIGYFDRQYGSTPEAVAAAAGTVVDGLAGAGVTATLKHFPGLGRVQANTDTSADVTDTVTTADDPQVALFGELAASSAAPFVMVSSATYALIDPDDQAAFSSVVLMGLLRGRLGFDGVVISDDLGNAEAVSDVPPGDRAVRFIAAGGTLLLTVDPELVPEMVDAVLARDASDPVFARTVDAAVRTALTAKQRAGLLEG
ncbi:glycoside hydrolase family 3 N-terminal domain-containing protein [Blastococcus litoris]|uniref:glycoside hydrolase family 3 N-terminal domain-containing protein n=1 Tax=Blastococcus litoris TaxID=2171622 RepID=UPI000E308125|nr:glycoside hydrolase family 3 N-terminal domain-containing protein [Blastococcus litoris]